MATGKNERNDEGEMYIFPVEEKRHILDQDIRRLQGRYTHVPPKIVRDIYMQKVLDTPATSPQLLVNVPNVAYRLTSNELDELYGKPSLRISQDMRESNECGDTETCISSHTSLRYRIRRLGGYFLFFGGE